MDNTPPLIFCPNVEDVTVSTGNTNGAIVNFPIPTASDNSGVTINAVLFPANQQGPNSLFGFGFHEITYRATDPSGNFRECTVSFTVGKFCNMSVVIIKQRNPYMTFLLKEITLQEFFFSF